MKLPCKHLFMLMAASLLAVKAHTKNIEVMTFNLRIPVDPAPYDWQSTLPRIIAIIKSQQPDFLGVQEVTPAMMNDLRSQLPDYGIVGRGRETDSGGEGNQIFYLKNRWALDEKDQGTLQLSPTPDVPGSNGWGMKFPRIMTWVHLRERTTGKWIYVFNTHFPLVATERYLSAQLLAEKISQRKRKKDPVILTGDFNACEDEVSMTYLMGQGNSPVALKDSYRLRYPGAKVSTFHGFGKEKSCKIDHIHVADKLKVLEAAVLEEADNFSSDHFPVRATLGF
jgi:endonuclease/exonuclease/phosphatase family metal-dependent hydrolase